MSHSELRNQSGQVLRDAEAGTTTIITSHGRPVAAIGPVPDLTTGPRLSRPATKHGFSGIRRHKIQASSQVILDELRAERL
ncbi:type II toxin-antitoxin system Phd/YefM family antitoxin [Conexibacter sp. S30A1]|uniref:type II toxin-antitoxin system Phd/YefM family antitoxin n=1 Tax=Conexibacter sp. S30A1 TaxID=2937800 RepID=UPI002112F9E5|nr:type II toxin-antitoxin system prevent-host-death family antitoxin [Conexibacter sp. S30A1]